MKLLWDNGFKRAFKKHVRRAPQLQASIFHALAWLKEGPFAPSLKNAQVGRAAWGVLGVLGRI